MPVTPGATDGGLGDPELNTAVAVDARVMLEHADTGVRRYGMSGAAGREDVEVFIHTFAPPVRM